MSTDTALETPTADPVLLAEQAALDETGAQPKQGGRFLTDEEWVEVMPPFFFIRVNFDQWDTLEYQVAQKFCAKNGTGWVYYSDKRFVFEKEEDYVLFRMWAENKPLTEENKVFEIK